MTHTLTGADVDLTLIDLPGIIQSEQVPAAAIDDDGHTCGSGTAARAQCWPVRLARLAPLHFACMHEHPCFQALVRMRALQGC